MCLVACPHFSEHWNPEKLCHRSIVFNSKSQVLGTSAWFQETPFLYCTLQKALCCKLSNIIAVCPFFRWVMFMWKLKGLPTFQEIATYILQCFVGILEWLLLIKCLLCTGGSFQRTRTKRDWGHAFPQSSQPSQDDNCGPHRRSKILCLPQDS